MKAGFKLRKVTINGADKYVVLQYKSIFRFLRFIKVWAYIKEPKTGAVRIFDDKRSAQAYINYATNSDMKNNKIYDVGI